ncbi:MAG: hypothetical protein ACP5NI_11615, partial [Acetobacteraceae bacterium]
MRRALPVSLLLLATLATPAGAAPPTALQQLQGAEADQAAHANAAAAAAARARAARAEADRLAAERVAAAARLRRAEDATAAAADRLVALGRRESAVKAGLARREAAFLPLLPLIERLSLYPGATLLAVPAPPEQALRGLLVLRGLARQIGTEAAALRAERARLARLDAAIHAEAAQFTMAEARQAAQEAALDHAIAAARATEQAASGVAAAEERAAA